MDLAGPKRRNETEAEGWSQLAMRAVFSIANGPLISYLPYYGASASPGGSDTVDMLENMPRADRESRAWR